MPKLTTSDHRRDSASLTYIYPVISRRSGGLSIGINLNPNNACNWRCVYCQVPNLTRGAAPEIDLRRLEEELNGLLESSLHGDFHERYRLSKEQRIIRDIAISGNGEPTSCREFNAIIRIIEKTRSKFALLESIALILITNGSLIHRQEIQRGLAHWSQLRGQVWFKIDRATEDGIHRINNIPLSPYTVLHHLEICARLCPTWIQTCLFAFDGQAPSQEEQQAYLDFLIETQRREIPLEGVLLYGLARPSMQVEAPRLSALTSTWLETLGCLIKEIGLNVLVFSHE